MVLRKLPNHAKFINTSQQNCTCMPLNGVTEEQVQDLKL